MNHHPLCQFGAIAALLLAIPAATAGEQEDLQEIRRLYKTITEAKASNTETIKIPDGERPLGGKLTRRHFPGGLQALTLEVSFGDHDGSSRHYYFKDGQLFFAFVQHHIWHFTGEQVDGQSTTIDKLEEERLYVRDGKCFKRLVRKVEGPDPDALEGLIAKVPNEEQEPDELTPILCTQGTMFFAAKNGVDLITALMWPE